MTRLFKPVFNSVVYSNRKNSMDFNYTNFVNDNSIFVSNNNFRNSLKMEEEFLEVFQSSFRFLNGEEGEKLCEENDYERSIFLMEESSPSNARSHSFEEFDDLGVVEQFMD